MVRPDSPNPRKAGFSLLEVVMALGIFAIAAVGLAEAITVISLSVNESLELSQVRERMRSKMVEVTRSPIERSETLNLNPDESGFAYRVEIVEMPLKNREGQNLDGLYEVTLSAIGPDGSIVDKISTLVNPSVYSP